MRRTQERTPSRQLPSLLHKALLLLSCTTQTAAVSAGTRMPIHRLSTHAWSATRLLPRGCASPCIDGEQDPPSSSHTTHIRMSHPDTRCVAGLRESPQSCHTRLMPYICLLSPESSCCRPSVTTTPNSSAACPYLPPTPAPALPPAAAASESAPAAPPPRPSMADISASWRALAVPPCAAPHV
jgi:hypothetical protein